MSQHLRALEIPQRAYTNGLLKAQAPARRVSYLPGGFTVGTVLDRKSGNNLIQISDAEDPLPTLDGQRWPERTRFYFQVCSSFTSRAWFAVQVLIGIVPCNSSVTLPTTRQLHCPSNVCAEREEGSLSWSQRKSRRCS